MLVDGYRLSCFQGRNGRYKVANDFDFDIQLSDSHCAYIDGYSGIGSYSDINGSIWSGATVNPTGASNFLWLPNLFGDEISRLSARISTCVG
jgi:hypothetical protein